MQGWSRKDRYQGGWRWAACAVAIAAAGSLGAARGATPDGATGACSTAVAEVAAGWGHTCGRLTDGTLWCWGSNGEGQLGDGMTSQGGPVPVQVGALGTSVAQVAAGDDHTCTRLTDGTLWCWGRNDLGQVGNGTTSPSSAVPAQVVSLGTSVAQVSVGALHTCARKTDGTLWCWGDNSEGELGDGTRSESPVPVQVRALGTNVIDVTAGLYRTCARTSDGTLWCWGGNWEGQLGNGNTNPSTVPVQAIMVGTGVVEVTMGESFNCALRNDGTVWCWGVYGMSHRRRVAIMQVTANATQIAAGDYHACARKTDGTLWCWAHNDAGQLGDGTTTYSEAPVQVAALGTRVAAVAAGGDHTCAIEDDGTLWCWGSNSSGEIAAAASVTQSPQPVQVDLQGATGACGDAGSP